MLSGGSVYSDTSLKDTIDLTSSLMYSMVLKVILHITISRFICKGANGSCLEGLAFTENNFCITMGFRLIVSGEIQIDIWLLIPLESQEGLKWNIKSLLR